jgi:hypothetical protein
MALMRIYAEGSGDFATAEVASQVIKALNRLEQFEKPLPAPY